MDGHGFDDLTRSMSRLGSRRKVLRALAGAALGAVGALGGAAAPTEAAVRCPRGKERCGGKCRAVCRGLKVRNRRTCRCECPDGMKACGSTCVGEDRCCPGEKECGGGCIAGDQCCPYTHHECPDGSCLEKDSGACCPGSQVACPGAEGGCCNALAGEECSGDGCCNTLVGGKAVCDGRCVDTDTDANNCGACGTTCRGDETCEGGACRSSSSCGAGKEPCGAWGCVTAGSCCGGKLVCGTTYSQCCTGGTMAGREAVCCYPQPLNYCKVSAPGAATCSSNP